jgi:hypothetical protein
VDSEETTARHRQNEDPDQAPGQDSARTQQHDEERMRDQNLRNARLPDIPARADKLGPGEHDAGLHDMGGDIGPASIRGSGGAPGGRADDEAEPRSGYAQPMGYTAGRDDEWPETAGSDEKAVGARPDEIEPHVETPGPTPHPMPPDPPDQGARTGHPAQPEFRAQGPAPGEEAGVIDDEPGPDEADLAADPPPEIPAASAHVTADDDWVPDDEDDPDAGSGRIDADDGGGYVPAD